MEFNGKVLETINNKPPQVQTIVSSKNVIKSFNF